MKGKRKEGLWWKSGTCYWSPLSQDSGWVNISIWTFWRGEPWGVLNILHFNCRVLVSTLRCNDVDHGAGNILVMIRFVSDNYIHIKTIYIKIYVDWVFMIASLHQHNLRPRKTQVGTQITFSPEKALEMCKRCLKFGKYQNFLGIFQMVNFMKLRRISMTEWSQ